MRKRIPLIACLIPLILVAGLTIPWSAAAASYHGTEGGGCDDLSGVAEVDPIDFETHIEPIFNIICTACHFPGGAAQAGGTSLDLRQGIAFDQLVDVASDQDASWTRVEPFSLADSLLFQKVNCSNPPVGVRMPQGGPFLSAEQQALIRDWIAQGALREPAGDPPPDPGQPINFGMSGSWFEPATAGQGFLFDVVSGFDPPLFVVYWFTYAAEAGGPEGQRWFIADGNYENGDSSVTLTVRMFTGGEFDTRPPDPEGVEVGAAELEFQSCTEATLTYAINLDDDDGLSREGVIPIERLSPDVMCEELAGDDG